MKDYYFSEDHKMFRESLRDYLDREVVPHIDAWEKEGRVPADGFRAFGDRG